MALIYRPKFQAQINGFDIFGKYNCTAYSAAIAIDRATLGGTEVTGRDVRRASDEPIPSQSSPGLNLAQTQEVAEGWHVSLLERRGEFVDVVTALKNGRGVMAQGDYDQMGAYSCQGTFLGDHCIELNNLNTSKVTIGGKVYLAGQAVLVYDPLCTKARYLPLEVIKRYCEKHAAATGGKVRYSVTRVTPNVAKQLNP
jgi:hypothetical protein